MNAILRAHVVRGRLVLDEPTNLPEGTFVELVAAAEGEPLDNEERRQLNEAISRGATAALAKDTVSPSELLSALRSIRLL